MPLQSALVGEAQAPIGRTSHHVGQVVGSMNAVKPGRQVVLDMMTKYADVADRFACEAADAS
jgi:hypothetical protein